MFLMIRLLLKLKRREDNNLTRIFLIFNFEATYECFIISIITLSIIYSNIKNNRVKWIILNVYWI